MAAAKQQPFPFAEDPDAIDKLSQLATGNPNLVTRPGLLQAMAQNNATQQQAEAINSFMIGLQAQQKVNLARNAGTKNISLGYDEKYALDSMNVDYSDVVAPPVPVVPATPVQPNAAPGMAPASDDTQAATSTPAKAPKKGDGWLSSFGSFGHHLLHNPVTNVITEGGNLVNSVTDQADQAVHAVMNPVDNFLAGGQTVNPQTGQVNDTTISSARAQGNIFLGTAAPKPGSAESSSMVNQGYDPSNPFSVLAFRAKGKSHSDTTDLATAWDTQNKGLFGWTGDQAVIEAEQFANDPAAYAKKIENDPSMDTDAKVALLSSKPFQTLITDVNARKASVGVDFARDAGIDPETHPTEFAITSAAVDTAASFLLDPTLAAGAANKAAKVASIGLDGLSDSTRAARILTVDTSAAAKGVQRGWTSAITDSNLISEGLSGAKAGTAEGEIQASKAMAHLRATTPWAVDYLPTLQGHGINFIKGGVKIEHDPITNLEQLASHLASTNGLLRLTTGRSMVETGLMPGTLSRFGFRKLKGVLSGAVAGRSTSQNIARDLELAKAADAGTINWARDASKFGPTPNDAVDSATGESKISNAADAATEGAAPAPLASAARAGVTRAASGQGMFNARRTGDIVDNTRNLNNWMSPVAQAERWKQMGIRMSTFLPRNDVVEHGAADSVEKVYRFGGYFLNRGDQALYAARFANGDEGVQTAVMDGMLEQTMHAAGLGATEEGRTYMATLHDRLNGNSYGHTGTEEIVDPVSGKSRDVAIYPSQVRSTTYMPSFKDLQMDSAKIGFWQNIVGRALTSPVTDALGDAARFAMLLKPNIAVRNIVEGQGNIATRGLFGQFLQAKTLLRDADIGAKQDAEAALRRAGVDDDDVIAAAKKDVTAQTPRKMIFQKAVDYSGLAQVGKAYRAFIGHTMPESWKGYAHEFIRNSPDEWRSSVLGLGEHIKAKNVDPHGIGDSGQILGIGLTAKQYRRVGFGMEDTSGVVGAERYAQALATRVGQYPDLDRAIIKAVQNPDTDIATVVDELRKIPQVGQMVRAGIYTTPDGATHVAVSAAQKQLALEQMARQQVMDMKYLLTNQNGDHIQSIADHIVNTRSAPSAKIIMSKLGDDAERPAEVLAPQYRALALNGRQGFVRQLMDSAGQSYKYLVEDTIKRTTTEPAFAMNYFRHRDVLEGARLDMIEKGGLSEDAAWRATHDIAIKRAYSATEEMIDDPGLKTQADIVGRNFFMFTRSIQAFARRWGGLAATNPTAFRRVFLATEGLHHAGLLTTDPNGSVNFTYPGSDMLMKGMAKLEGLIPGLGPAVKYPLSGSLTGQLNMIAPGIDNPARVSLSPMLETPFKVFQTLVPQYQQQMNVLDSVLNGDEAIGKSPWSAWVPGIVSKFTAAQKGDDRDSAFASSVVGAIANLEAADPDGKKGLFPPPGATPSQVDKFIQQLGKQVQNQLYLRAAFGEFAPAPPGLPSETTAAGEKVDPLFSARGITNLSDEYKTILNDVGGDTAAAQQLFLANHPERAVFTIPASVSKTNKAYLPSTATAENWINSSLPFINSYDQVAAYFVPQDAGEFDLAAYRAQIETGLRQKSTPTEFYDRFRTITAEDTYYSAMDQRDAAVDAALSKGDKDRAADIKTGFSTWAAGFTAANPIFAQKQANYAEMTADAKNAVTDLSNIVQSDGKNIPPNVRALVPQLTQMINAYNNHTQWNLENNGETAVDKLRNAAETQAYGTYMANIAKSNPNLSSVYNGVFKAIDTDLPSLTPVPTTATTTATTTKTGAASATAK